MRARRYQRVGRWPLNPNKYLKLGSQEIPLFPKRKVSYPVFYGRSHPRKLRHSFERHRQGRVVLVRVGVRSCPVYSELPNIPVGSLPVIAYNRKDPDLPFKVLSRYGDYVTTDEVTTRYWQNTQIGFDLQASNPIYGASDTVRPDALMGYWMIRF